MRRYLSNGILIAGLCAAFATGRPLLADSAVPNSASEVHPLLIGAKAPEVKLHDADGGEVELTDVLGGKPTILFFYRGGW